MTSAAMATESEEDSWQLTLPTSKKESWQLSVVQPFSFDALAAAEEERVKARLEGQQMLAVEQNAYDEMVISKGQDHPDTITAMVSLALKYRQEEHWLTSTEMLDDAVKLRKRVLGAEHPDTVACMKQLLETLKMRNKYPAIADIQMIDFRRDWLELNVERYVYETFSQDQLLYINERNWRRTEQPCKEILAMRTKKFGPDHPDTLSSRQNLGLVYARQERWKEAAKEFQKVLDARQKLGPDRPETISTAKSLTLIYSRLEKWKEQEKVELFLLEHFKKTPSDHPHIAKSMEHLVLIYLRQRRNKEAEEQERQLLSMRRQVLGEEHPDTLTTMENLAYTMKIRRLDDEALEMMKECAELSEKTLGENHNKTWQRQRVVRKWTPLDIDVDLNLSKLDMTKWMTEKLTSRPALLDRVRGSQKLLKR